MEGRATERQKKRPTLRSLRRRALGVRMVSWNYITFNFQPLSVLTRFSVIVFSVSSP